MPKRNKKPNFWRKAKKVTVARSGRDLELTWSFRGESANDLAHWILKNPEFFGSPSDDLS